MKRTFYLFFIISLCFTKMVMAQSVSCAIFLEKLNQTEAPFNNVTDEGVHELRAPFWFNIRKLKDVDVKNNLYTVDYKFRVLYLDPNLKYLAEKLGLSDGFYCPFAYSEIADRYSSLDFYTTSIEDLKTTNDTINFNYVDGDFFIVRLIEKISLFSATTTRDFRQFPLMNINLIFASMQRICF